MSWASTAIEQLKQGRTVTIRPCGHSMTPLILSKQQVELKPAKSDDVEVGDIVLCKVRGKTYLHLVKAKQGNRVLIGNNKGGTNGWTSTVYGVKTGTGTNLS